MEEMTEVDLDGKRYVWDGEAWAEARTWMVPPDNVINKLNMTYRKHEVDLKPAARAPRARTPRASSGPKARFVPAKSLTRKRMKRRCRRMRPPPNFRLFSKTTT